MTLDTIYNMDCLEGMKQIPDGTIDAVICDLPYGTTACAWDSVIPFEPLWEQFKRVTKPNAAIVLFGSEPFSTIQRISNFSHYKYDWVWNKALAGNGILAKHQPLKIHETISVFCYGKCPYNPQKVKGKHRIKMSNLKESELTYGDSTAKSYSNNEYYPVSILDYSVASLRGEDRLHPTQKPVDLLRYLILTYSNEGDTILDATIGSGTTAVAALMEKRHFIGFELSKEYFDKAVQRIKAEQAQLTLF